MLSMQHSMCAQENIRQPQFCNLMLSGCEILCSSQAVAQTYSTLLHVTDIVQIGAWLTLLHDVGLAVAHVSDTSLHHFVTTKKKLRATGQRPKQQLLQTGQ